MYPVEVRADGGSGYLVDNMGQNSVLSTSNVFMSKPRLTGKPQLFSNVSVVSSVSLLGAPSS